MPIRNRLLYKTTLRNNYWAVCQVENFDRSRKKIEIIIRTGLLEGRLTQSTHIWTSDSPHAKETAEEIAKHLKIPFQEIKYTNYLEERDELKEENLLKISQEERKKVIEEVLSKISLFIWSLEQNVDQTFLLVSEKNILQILQAACEKRDSTTYLEVPPFDPAEMRKLELT